MRKLLLISTSKRTEPEGVGVWALITQVLHITCNKFELPDGWRVGVVQDVAVVNEQSVQRDYKHEWVEYIDIASVEKEQLRTSGAFSLCQPQQVLSGHVQIRQSAYHKQSVGVLHKARYRTLQKPKIRLNTRG